MDCCAPTAGRKPSVRSCATSRTPNARCSTSSTGHSRRDLASQLGLSWCELGAFDGGRTGGLTGQVERRVQDAALIHRRRDGPALVRASKRWPGHPDSSGGPTACHRAQLAVRAAQPVPRPQAGKLIFRDPTAGSPCPRCDGCPHRSPPAGSADSSTEPGIRWPRTANPHLLITRVTASDENQPAVALTVIEAFFAPPHPERRSTLPL